MTVRPRAHGHGCRSPYAGTMGKLAAGVALAAMLVACSSADRSDRPSVDECEDAENAIKDRVKRTTHCQGQVPAEIVEACRVWAECKATHVEIGGTLF